MKSLYTYLNIDSNTDKFGSSYIYECITGLNSPELKEHYLSTELLINIKALTYYIPLHTDFFKTGSLLVGTYQYCILKVCQEEDLPEEFTASSILSLALMMGANFKIREYFLHHLKEVKAIYQEHVDFHLSLKVEPSAETQKLLNACNKFIDTVETYLEVDEK